MLNIETYFRRITKQLKNHPDFKRVKLDSWFEQHVSFEYKGGSYALVWDPDSKGFFIVSFRTDEHHSFFEQNRRGEKPTLKEIKQHLEMIRI